MGARNVEGQSKGQGRKTGSCVHNHFFLLCGVENQKSQPSEKKRKLHPALNSAVVWGGTLALQSIVLAPGYYPFAFLKVVLFLPVWQQICGINAHSVTLWKLCQLALWCFWRSCQKVKRLNGVGKSSCKFYKTILSEKLSHNYFWSLRSPWFSRADSCPNSNSSLPLGPTSQRRPRNGPRIWAPFMATVSGRSYLPPHFRGHTCTTLTARLILCFTWV